VNARQLDEGKEEDFAAVILQMEKQPHLDCVEKGRAQFAVASTKKQV
jgi:hypothetical protein